MPCKEYHTINMYQDTLRLQFNQFNLVYCFLQWQSFKSHVLYLCTCIYTYENKQNLCVYWNIEASALLTHQGYFVLFILVLLKFTERSYLYNLNPKEMSLSKIPNYYNGCINEDLSSYRPSWEAGWHVSLVPVTLKTSQSWMGTSPEGTMATAVKMSNTKVEEF